MPPDRLGNFVCRLYGNLRIGARAALLRFAKATHSMTDSFIEAFERARDIVTDSDGRRLAVPVKKPPNPRDFGIFCHSFRPIAGVYSAPRQWL